MKKTPKSNESAIKSEQQLDEALEVLNSKKKLNLRRTTEVQIALYALMLLAGPLLFMDIGHSDGGTLRMPLMRIVGVLVALWAAVGLYVFIGRFKRREWNVLTDTYMKFYKFQVIIGFIALNLMMIGGQIAGSIDKGRFSPSVLVIILIFGVLYNALFWLVMRRDYQRMREELIEREV